MRSKASLVRTLVKRGPHGGKRKRIARQGSADAAGIAVFEALALENHVRDFFREAVGRARDSAGDGFAEDEEIGIEIFGASVAAGPGANGVRLVDDEQGAVFSRELAQRLVVAGIGMHDAHVGHDRLGQHAGHVAGSQRLFQRGDVVELNHLGGDGRIDRRADVAAAGLRAPSFRVMKLSSTVP